MILTRRHGYVNSHAMRHHIHCGSELDDQRDSFDSHGWLVLRNAVGGTDLDELNRVFDRLMGDLTGIKTGGGIHQRPNSSHGNPVLLKHLYNGVAEIVCYLLRTPSVQLLQDTLLLKSAATDGRIALHQDYSYTGFLDPPAMVSVGLALTDASVEAGCLHVIDGSHRWGLAGDFHVFAGHLQTQVDRLLSPQQREFVTGSKLPLEVRAGDVTIHHCLTFHGSDENKSARPRKAIVTHLFSGDCKLVTERLPAYATDHFPTDVDGHLTGPAFPILHPIK